MNEEAKTKWYHLNTSVLIALACLGPFGLPLVWRNPRYSRFTKMWITVLVIVVTVLLCYAAYVLIVLLIRQIKDLMAM